jgi:hypothetical protein
MQPVQSAGALPHNGASGEVVHAPSKPIPSVGLATKAGQNTRVRICSEGAASVPLHSTERQLSAPERSAGGIGTLPPLLTAIHKWLGATCALPGGPGISAAAAPVRAAKKRAPRFRSNWWPSVLLLNIIYVAAVLHDHSLAKSLTIDGLSDSQRSNLGSECTPRYHLFVNELDVILTANPPSIDEIDVLLHKYFPFHGCNTAEILEESRKSKYFLKIEEWPKQYVIVFDSRIDGRVGYNVSFGLMKDSGDSIYPAAKSK